MYQRSCIKQRGSCSLHLLRGLSKNLRASSSATSRPRRASALPTMRTDLRAYPTQKAMQGRHRRWQQAAIQCRIVPCACLVCTDNALQASRNIEEVMTDHVKLMW